MHEHYQKETAIEREREGEGEKDRESKPNLIRNGNRRRQFCLTFNLAGFVSLDVIGFDGVTTSKSERERDRKSERERDRKRQLASQSCRQTLANGAANRCGPKMSRQPVSLICLRL